MAKLTLYDIKIITPGNQVKELIIKSFGSIEAFAKQIEIDVEKVNQYLKKQNLGPKLFKSKLQEIFKEDFIILSENEQIQIMVRKAYDNIEKYTQHEDFFILNDLKQLCIGNKLLLEASKMYRNIAKHYFYNNNISYAISYISKAIENLKSKLKSQKNIKKYVIEWKSELSLFYYYQCDYKSAKINNIEIDELIDSDIKLDYKIMYLHYYRCGIVDNQINNYAVAEIMFRKSIEYAKSNNDIGDAYTSIGISLRRRGKIDKAIEFYKKALQVHDNDLNKSITYNNLADLYKNINDYDEALKNIKLAFDHIDNDNVLEQFIFYQTYSQIQILKGKYDDVISKLYELIMKIENITLYKQTIIDGIKTLIDYCIKTNNFDMMKHIQEFTIKLITETPQKYENYLYRLYAFLGEIRLYSINFNEK